MCKIALPILFLVFSVTFACPNFTDLKACMNEGLAAMSEESKTSLVCSAACSSILSKIDTKTCFLKLKHLAQAYGFVEALGGEENAYGKACNIFKTCEMGQYQCDWVCQTSMVPVSHTANQVSQTQGLSPTNRTTLLVQPGHGSMDHHEPWLSLFIGIFCTVIVIFVGVCLTLHFRRKRYLPQTQDNPISSISIPEAADESHSITALAELRSVNNGVDEGKQTVLPDIHSPIELENINALSTSLPSQSITSL